MQRKLKFQKLIVMPVDGIFITLVISGFLLLSTLSVIGYLIYAFCIRCTNYSSDDSRSDAFEYEDNVTADNISLNELNHIWQTSTIFQMVEIFEIKCHYYYENQYCGCFKSKHLIFHIFSYLTYHALSVHKLKPISFIANNNLFYRAWYK